MMSPPPELLRYPILLCLMLLTTIGIAAAGAGGSWELLLPSIGISAMHMQLLHTDRVVIFDRTDFGLSNISLPAGKCESLSFSDCSAHSVEYDVTSKSIRPLTILTDTWCSSGAMLPDGTLIQTGGYNSGDHAVRTYNPNSCTQVCDWVEKNQGLVQKRWYATNHILPDGRRIIIVGGRRQFNYEFYPRNSPTEASFNLPFLSQTNDPGSENNLYPFVFLNVDGNLFILANNRAILYNYLTRAVVKTYPVIPGGEPRNYPSSGSAVLLPLRNNTGAEVLVCGGAPKGSYISATKGSFTAALNSCGRIRINDPDPQWAMESMPIARVMGDMILLPNGEVLIVNGAGSGTAGWELGRDPVLSPVIYNPDKESESRFKIQNPTTIPRMYHSTVVLLRDGRVLVGGSNPHSHYNFTGVLFPTELSLEAFSPPYLSADLSSLRPKIVAPESHARFRHKEEFLVTFSVEDLIDGNSVMVTMVAPSFTTHSFAMNQRLLVLGTRNLTAAPGGSMYQISATAPISGNVAPPGYYMVFVVHGGVPSEGVWIQIMGD